MNQQIADITSRRLVLLEKIKVQRMELVEISQQFHKPLALVDGGIKAVRFIGNHPTLLRGGIALLLALLRGNLPLMVRQGWRLISLYPTVVFALRSVRHHN